MANVARSAQIVRVQAAVFVLAFLFSPASLVRAQEGTPARNRAAELSRAWAAVAEGNFARADQIAASLLRDVPADHSAVTVNLVALAADGRPVAALDVYERWLERARQDDIFLLQPIASGTLAEIGSGADVGLAVEALNQLAARDPDAARAALARRADAGAEFDSVRAGLGDTAAANRLISALAAPTAREKLLALHGLAAVSDIPAPPLIALLSDPAPPVKTAAMETLARVQGTRASDALRPMLADTDPFVKASAAVALGRLGDTAGLEALGTMLDSPVPDTSAMAAAVLKDRGVDVSAAVTRILAAENPLTRLSAVPLLEPSQAQVLLRQAASDPNPVIRARATELMASAPVDLVTVRRLLRDGNVEVRLHAAVSLLSPAPRAR